MSLKDEFRKMVNELAAKFTLPPIANIFLPPFYKGGQPKDAQFMAISLEGGATGISFVLLPDEKMEEYTALQPPAFVEKNPRHLLVCRHQWRLSIISCTRLFLNILQHAQQTADCQQKTTRRLYSDFMRGWSEMAHIKGQQVRTSFLQGGDKNRQVFGIRLFLICSEVT